MLRLRTGLETGSRVLRALDLGFSGLREVWGLEVKDVGFRFWFRAGN